MTSAPVMRIEDDWRDAEEHLGSKHKFWVKVPPTGQRALFKLSRPDTCEHASEFLAARIAEALGIDCAKVELAQYRGKSGCLSYSFVSREKGDELIHGNVILAGLLTDYDASLCGRHAMHTINNISRAIRIACADQERESLRSLARILILDAIIGNTDRHHENWGVLSRISADGLRTRGLAPAFDNASSLGRELSPVRRQRLVRNGAVEKYWRKAESAIRLDLDARSPHPVEVLVEFIRNEPVISLEELVRLRCIGVNRFLQSFAVTDSAECPEEFIEFARVMCLHSFAEITSLEERLQ